MVCLSLAAERIINAPAQSLNWKKTPEGVAFASLVGDRFNEAYMAMVKLPGGLVSPAHIKSANMFGVMVSGAMVHEAPGESFSPVLRVGSFYKIPKNVPHVSKCVSKEDCVTFLYQDGEFDFLTDNDKSNRAFITAGAKRWLGPLNSFLCTKNNKC